MPREAIEVKKGEKKVLKANPLIVINVNKNKGLGNNQTCALKSNLHCFTLLAGTFLLVTNKKKYKLVLKVVTRKTSHHILSDIHNIPTCISLSCGHLPVSPTSVCLPATASHFPPCQLNALSSWQLNEFSMFRKKWWIFYVPNLCSFSWIRHSGSCAEMQGSSTSKSRESLMSLTHY